MKKFIVYTFKGDSVGLVYFAVSASDARKQAELEGHKVYRVR